MSALLDNLPDDWKFITLGDLNTQKAPTLRPNDFPNETFEYYSIPDYQRDQQPSFIKGTEIGSSKLLLKPRTILFGKLNPRVEKVWRVSKSSEHRQIGSTEWIAILPDNRVDTNFLYFLELSDHVMPIAKTFVSGSTPSRQRVDPTSFYRLQVPIPPLPEQKKIAHILSTVQRAIEAQVRIIQTTTELKKTLMRKLFTEGLHNEPQKQTEIGPIPESWEVEKLDRTGTVVYGIQASVANNLVSIGTRILTNKNLTLDGGFDLGKINYFELRNKRHLNTILRKGDILFNWRSGSKHHIGKTAYFNLDGEWVHSSFILRIRPNPQINGRFLFYYLYYLREVEYFVKLHTYAINAKFNKSAVNALTTVIPSREEQDEIANALDSVQRKIELAVIKQRALQNLFRTLLHELMTAKIRVTSFDCSPRKS